MIARAGKANLQSTATRRSTRSTSIALIFAIKIDNSVYLFAIA